MSRNLITFVIAGTALGLGGIASAQSSLDLDRAYAAELSADAATRTSNLYDARDTGGFNIAGNGSNTLNIGALFQYRYVASFRDDQNPAADTPAGAVIGDDNDFAHGFEIQRARLDFTGTVINPNISYRFSGDFSDQPSISGGDDGDFNITWAYGQYNFEGSLDGAFVRWGQFKLPIFYEELVAPEFQLTAERSLANEYFSQQYSQGLMFGYQGNSFAAYFAVSDGVNSRGTEFNTAGEADVAVTGRVDFKFTGDWAQFEDFTSFRNSETAGRIGAAVHWETFGDTAPSQVGASSQTATSIFEDLDGDGILEDGEVISIGSGDVFYYTADIQFEGSGWNGFAAFYGAFTDAEEGFDDGDATTNDEIDEDYNDFGAVVQGGYFFTEQFEGFARYDGIYIDEDRLGGSNEDSEFNFLTFGINYYIVPESHAAKFTLDALFSFDQTDSLIVPIGLLPNNSTGSITGLQGSPDDFEVAIRAQLQLLF